MIFKRRDKPPFWGRLREVLYPRKGFWRGMGYVRKRLHRLPDSPHRIALGFACGAFISFTPFFTLHFFLAAALAWAFRANILASIFGTAVGNPLTFPFIATGSLWLGRYLLGRGGEQSNFEAVTHAFAEAFNSLSLTMQSWFGYGPSMADGLLLFLDDVRRPGTGSCLRRCLLLDHRTNRGSLSGTPEQEAGSAGRACPAGGVR
jgi:uncharacterized protein (DUF2062 family)